MCYVTGKVFDRVEGKTSFQNTRKVWKSLMLIAFIGIVELEFIYLNSVWE